MKIRILRPRGIGRTSADSLLENMKTPIEIIKSWEEIPQDTGILFRWGCTTKCPSKICYNKAEAISFCSNKKISRLALQYEEISVPPSIENEKLDINFPFPVIIRPEQHSKGRNLYYFENWSKYLRSELYHYPAFYASEYIQKEREFRFYIINQRLAWIAEKFVKDKTQLAWNSAQGGEFINIPIENYREYFQGVCSAIDASVFAKIDFCGVDVIMDKDGKYYVLELNSAPSLTEIHRQRIFANVFDYVIERTYINEKFIHYKENPPGNPPGNIEDFIHSFYRKR